LCCRNITDYPFTRRAGTDLKYSDDDSEVRPPYLNEKAPPQHSELSRLLEKIGRKPVSRIRPVVVTCGPRPQNASGNCKPWLQACLFNISADPCEYDNLAASRPELVGAMLKRVEFYRQNSARPLNQPVDDAGLPYHHHWNWVPWRKPASSQTSDNAA